MGLTVLRIFLGLLLVLGPAVPAPGPADYLPGGVLPPEGTPPVCFRLGYPVSAETAGLPTSVRLLHERLGSGGGPVIYRAEPQLGSRGNHGGWRAAGPDSIEFASHHSALIRLPRTGRVRVGRVIPFWQGTLLDILLGPPKEFAVRAIAEPCPID